MTEFKKYRVKQDKLYKSDFDLLMAESGLIDENNEELRNSIIESGVLDPVIVRKSDDGKYEMLSGHRRKKICEEQGICDLSKL